MPTPLPKARSESDAHFAPRIKHHQYHSVTYLLLAAKASDKLHFENPISKRTESPFAESRVIQQMGGML